RIVGIVIHADLIARHVTVHDSAGAVGIAVPDLRTERDALTHVTISINFILIQHFWIIRGASSAFAGMGRARLNGRCADSAKRRGPIPTRLRLLIVTTPYKEKDQRDDEKRQDDNARNQRAC